MEENEYEIEEINFGVYSAEEIRKMSVCEINNPKLCNSDKNGSHGTVYDPRLGTIENDASCATCSRTVWECPGHWGYINLNEPVIHPLYFKQVINFLRCYCTKCNKLLITEDQILINNLNRTTGVKRFNKILERLDKIDMCTHCSHPQPFIKHTITDNTISMVYKDRDKRKVSIMLQVDEIKKIFDNISIRDVELLGFNPQMMHPKNLIITVFPVIPTCARPYVISAENVCDDDLTIQLVEIIKANNHLEQTDNVPITDTKKQKYLQCLKFRISTLYNNSSGKAKHSTNKRPIKGIKERLTGKDGLIRTNLMGKRCEMTARTVIGPDPTLKMGQLAVPPQIAKNLTIPVRVTSFNYDFLTSLIHEGKVNYVLKDNGQTRINLDNALFFKGTRINHGDIIYRNNKITGKDDEILVTNGKDLLQKGDKLKRNGDWIMDLKYPEKRSYKLVIGDICERQMYDGCIVLLNRQPTLHAGSMMAQEVVIRPGKTLRFNLSINKSFNADFDGDEMNLHLPASLEAEAELRYLSASKHKIISPQSSKNIMCIVQDSLLGAYCMTIGIQQLRKDQFFNIALQTGLSIDKILSKIQHIRRIYKEKGKKAQSFHGKGLISLALPDDFMYEKKNDIDPNEPIVKIYRGVLYEGTLNKSILGSVHNSIIQLINKEYGSDQAAEFIDYIQFITNNWLLIYGFSIGLKDCMVQGEDKVQEINDIIEKCYIEAENIKNTTFNKNIREIRITSTLSKAKDIGLKIAKDALDPSNNFLKTVKSGSKGDLFNIAQVTGLLGQQNVSGQRVQPTLNNGTRTLPHYPFTDLSRRDEYESKGFIDSSFIAGLNPKQYFFHSMSGRESTCDTAMSTATSGYIQRRIVKLLEDVKTQYGGSVRDCCNSVYQWAYGEDGLDPLKLIKVGNQLEICNVSNLVDKLNMKYEIINKVSNKVSNKNNKRKRFE